MDGLGRREFLKRGALAAAVLSVAPFESFAFGPGALRLGVPTRRVVVAGAGLAGLVAAYELSRAGHDVTLLEARDRAGGRVRTVREPFAEGQHAEAGAARIPAEHELTLQYVKHFNLSLEYFYPERNYVHYRRGRRETIHWKSFEDKLGTYFGFEFGPDPRKIFRVRGGNDLLTQAFADRLKGRITYDAPVVAIEQDARGVRINFNRGGTRQALAADYFVCTIPFSVLRRVEFTPPLAADKRKIVETMQYTSASRVLVQFKSRVWGEPRLSGFGVTDAPTEIWQPTYTQPGARGILTTYPRGPLSEKLTAMPEEARLSSTVELLERVFPGARADFAAGVSKCWQEDEWALGAWGHPDEKLLPVITRPEGRVHFAGEHASRLASWMQGALESGLRAAREINETAARDNTSTLRRNLTNAARAET
ncbi:MAG TPA: FAD-dependent oxidoreductase [Pyrinomonadaceae bacterium]|nr:FAD-dependent oxidoreductase [Pyrinomonadaceae bacterium]